MEYNIYDLMEGIADDDTITLSPSGTADLRRIEELTMNKIKEQNEGRRVKKPVRRVTRMVLVAAIVAALCAVRVCPAAAKAVFASHVSSEPAARLVLEELDKKPLITANLHLGEGTGAVASLPLWDMALAVYGGCYSFAEGGIAPYTPQC